MADLAFDCAELIENGRCNSRATALKSLKRAWRPHLACTSLIQPSVSVLDALTTMSDRPRSASPVREPRPKKQKTGGFKWKDKKPRDEEQNSRDSGRLERGYRDRSPRRTTHRDHEPERSGKGGDGHGEHAKEHLPKRQETEDDKPTQTPKDEPVDEASSKPAETRRDPFAGYKPRPPSNPAPTPTPTTPSDIGKPKKPKKPKPPPTPTGPMIIVHVNDRLGTKAAIPCLASDSVKAFKAIVAAHIGRQPHEIMIKRQGERPFKDVLTLEDYGVSSGVQLDLELDTGD